ncbi:unnamed protein product [Moneuplotes crassus]|uniref:Adiponectin receptor protein n=1 Tax=Euplotes crassus TaxID=5936 RepID=A0AAD1UCW0_EUPCR|nr:unnamed protein product [Moneuplotes crassus]
MRFYDVQDKRIQSLDLFKPSTKAQDILIGVKSIIGSIKEAPHFLLDNEHIHTEYRIGFDSPLKILKSLFMIHNESVNVWTHLIGVIIFIVFISYTAIKLGPNINSDIHLKVMEQFHSIYHLSDDISFCDGEEIHNSTEKIFKIYDEGIKIDSPSCHREANFGHHNEDFECANTERTSNQTYFNFDLQNSTTSEVEQNLDFVLDRVETYIHSLIEGVKILSLKTLSKYIDEVHEGVKDKYKSMRMVTLKSLSSKVPDLLHEIVQEQNSGNMPDITFSSYFESPGEILHDITRIPLYIHMLSAVCCLGCSAIYRLFFVHSSKISDILSRLDYAGIAFFIEGSCVPPVYYSLYCSNFDLLRPLYLLITFIGCFGVFTVTMIPKFNTPKYRPFRALLFVVLGVSAAFPCIQFIYFRDPLTMPVFPTNYWTLGGATYIFGAYVYTMRFPERWYPDKFDMCGHSHNLWHCFVLVAAIVHYYGSLEVYHLRRNFECPV